MVEYHQQFDEDTYLYRRRASDRARERAGRAAWYGDRAGLLIATGTVEALMRVRSEAGRDASDAMEGSSGN
jgi:acyl-CoA thioesterase